MGKCAFIRNLTFFLTAIFIFLFSFTGDLYAKKDTPVGKEYYTTSNIWYEHPERIFSTNFHKGVIIPAGTEVNIVKYGRGKIKFQPLDSDTVFTFNRVTRHSVISLGELFSRYFSTENVMAKDGKFYDLTKAEQKNVKEGRIENGMSKAAVIMAYGYPPSHMTPSLDSNLWTYWDSRAGRLVVHFRDGKISEIER